MLYLAKCTFLEWWNLLVWSDALSTMCEYVQLLAKLKGNIARLRRGSTVLGVKVCLSVCLSVCLRKQRTTVTFTTIDDPPRYFSPLPPQQISDPDSPIQHFALDSVSKTEDRLAVETKLQASAMEGKTQKLLTFRLILVSRVWFTVKGYVAHDAIYSLFEECNVRFSAAHCG